MEEKNQGASAPQTALSGDDRVRELEAENLRLKDDLAEMKADLDYVFGLLPNHVARTRPGKLTASTRCPICGAWEVHLHTYAEEWAWRQKERALATSTAEPRAAAPEALSLDDAAGITDVIRGTAAQGEEK